MIPDHLEHAKVRDPRFEGISPEAEVVPGIDVEIARRQAEEADQDP